MIVQVRDGIQSKIHEVGNLIVERPYSTHRQTKCHNKDEKQKMNGSAKHTHRVMRGETNTHTHTKGEILRERFFSFQFIIFRKWI